MEITAFLYGDYNEQLNSLTTHVSTHMLSMYGDSSFEVDMKPRLRALSLKPSGLTFLSPPGHCALELECRHTIRVASFPITVSRLVLCWCLYACMLSPVATPHLEAQPRTLKLSYI